MKKVLITGVFLAGLTLMSCSKSNCKECTSCETKATATLCEEDFEKTSDYEDQLDNYTSDGCDCKNK